MYELARLSLTNWNLIDIEDIEVDGTTALIGAVGVGKSTLLDAIQTVLSGHQRNKTKLNHAAGVHGSKRSVREYCLGFTEDTIANGETRDACHSILVLTFRDRKLRHSVAIGLVLYADVDRPVAETVARFIAPGVDFSFDTFADREPGGEMTIGSHEVILDRIRIAAGPRFRTYNQAAGVFVENYLRAMRPNGVAPDATQFLKRFQNAIAFREIENPTDFVRRFVLDEQPIDTEALRASLQTWEELAELIVALERKISEAKALRTRYLRHAEHQIRKLAVRFEGLWHEERAAAILLGEQESASAEAAAAIDDTRERIARIRGRIATEEAARDRKKEMERAAGYTESRARIESELRAARSELGAALREVIEALKLAGAVAGTEAADYHLPAYVKAARPAAARLEDIRRALAVTGTISVSPDELLADLKTVAATARAAEALATVQKAELLELAKVEEIHRSLTHRMQTAHGGKAFLGQQTTDFLDALLHQSVVGQALPDLVEIDEEMEDWIRAAEAVLGLFREAVYVEPKDMETALETLRHGRRGGEQYYYDVRLIDSARIARDDGTRAAKPDAVVSVLRTQNPIVRRFLDSRFGHVVRAETVADLKAHPGAIMKDCTQSQGLAYQVHRKREPLLGRMAQLRLSRQMTADLSDARDRMTELGARLDVLRAAERVFGNLAEVDTDRIAEILSQVGSMTAAIDELDRRRTEAVSPEVAQLIREIEEHDRTIKALRATIETELEPAVQRALLEKQKAEIEASRLTAARQATASEIAALKATERAEPFLTFRKAFYDLERSQIESLESIKQKLARHADEPTDWHRRRSAELSAERHTLDLGDAQIQSYLKGIIPFVTEHGEDVAVASRSAEEILTWLVALVYNLEENELRAYTGRIHEFREAARREVREMLVMKLHDKLLSAQGELKKLNRRLRQHRFEGLTYVFDWQIDPVKRPLYEMARRVAAEPDRADALLAEGGEPILDEAVALIRDIFRSDGGSTAGFEDYRQYFTYELRMTHDTITDADIDAHGPEGMSRVRFTGNLTDRVGKGSGGQKQTPYYVAIAASMAAAYYPASRLGETQGLGLVCFDEAFSKLDIRNTQELIRFFRDLSLQIVVAAPEEKRTSFMELMDTMVNISKLPGDNILHITSERIGPRA